MPKVERDTDIYKYPMKIWRNFKVYSRSHLDEEMTYKSHTVTALLPI